jgi:hypothetical protein
VVASSADLVCSIHQNAVLFPHLGHSIVVVGSAAGLLSVSITLRELLEMLSCMDETFLDNDSCSSLSAVKPHFGHSTMPCSILGFMRVSHFGQNFKNNFTSYFFKFVFNVLAISLR